MTDITVVHSSDLHIGRTEDLHSLYRVLDAAIAADGQMLLLAGDTFDHNRLPWLLLDGVTRLLEQTALPVVLLPGNHDCITPESVYHRGGFLSLANVKVIGWDQQERILMPDLDVEIWGRPHLDYADMAPLGETRPRGARWQIAMAHGHYLGHPYDVGRGWLFDDAQIAATGADYVALGHWDKAMRVGNGSVPAYYSGSPGVAKSVNVVDLQDEGGVLVRRVPLNGRGPAL